MNISEAKAEVREDAQARCGYMTDAYGHSGGDLLEPCDKCGGEKVCGPWVHVCLKCDPWMKFHCRVCDVERWRCCC